jgi:type VI secretion system secreted protein Hcp
MNAVVNNENVVEAKLTMCKAGGDPLGYFVMTLNNARVTAVEIDVGSDGRPIERVSFAFAKIEVDYTPQTPDGIGGGATTFSDEWTAPAPP